MPGGHVRLIRREVGYLRRRLVGGGEWVAARALGQRVGELAQQMWVQATAAAVFAA